MSDEKFKITEGEPTEYLCPKHGKIDFHVTFWHDKTKTDETYCLHCMLELLKEKLKPIKEHKT